MSKPSPGPFELRSFKAILLSFPDMKAVASSIGVSYWTVTAWNRRDYVPPNYFPHLVKAAKEHRIRGVTQELLFRLSTERSEERLEATRARRSRVLEAHEEARARQRRTRAASSASFANDSPSNLSSRRAPAHAET